MKHGQHTKKKPHNPCPLSHIPASLLDPLLDVKEVAAYLGVSTSTVYRYIYRGLPCSKIGIYFFRKEKVDEWLNHYKRRSFNIDEILKNALTSSPPSDNHKLKGGKDKLAKKGQTCNNYGYGSIYSRKTKSGMVRWYIYYHDSQGKRIRRVIPDAQTKEQAHFELKKAVLESFNKNHNVENEQRRTNFKDFSSMYLKEYAEVEKTSWKTDEFRLRSLLRFFNDVELQRIAPQMIRAYKASRLREGRTESTVNREVALLKKMFNYAVEEGYLNTNPASKIKQYSEIDIVRDRILTVDEENRLFHELADHVKPIVLAALHTGIRLGKLLALKWTDVNFKSGQIKVEHTKNKKARFIPINSVLFEELIRLKSIRNSDIRIFPFKSIRTAFEKACKRACVEDFTFHDLRRTFGTRLLENGVDIVTIQKLYGHSSVLVTQKYLHPKDETSMEAVESLCRKGGTLTHHRHTEQDKQTPEFPTYEFSVN